MIFANVVIAPLETSYSYLVPHELEESVALGQRVEVPLGTRTVQGFIVGLTTTPPAQLSKIKPLKRLVHDDTCFHQADLTFFSWVAEYYAEPLSSVIDVAIPPWQSGKIEKFYTIPQADALETIKGSVQRRICEHLLSNQQKEGVPHEALMRCIPTATASLRELIKKKIVTVSQREVRTSLITTEVSWAKKDITLSPEQRHATAEIQSTLRQQISEPFLLHGVTGSGKTEVYIEAIRFALEQGRGAIVIVPEIALTSQLVHRFYARLGSTIALLHSGLHKRERWENWRSLVEGTKRVAIGARSAIFAPVHNLGIIVVDEEHDSSYKQHEGLRYNARDIAYVKAKHANAALVLGSATPSLETFHRAEEKQIRKIILPSKHSKHAKLSIETIDLNLYKPWEMASPNISPRLYTLLKEVIAKNELAFVLYNRRGFASYLQCDTCDSLLTCPHCAVSFTYHQRHHELVCHYCNLKRPVPSFCPTCNRTDGAVPGSLKLHGAGTEKTEEEIQLLFPEAKILRLDRDVASHPDEYDAILQKMRDKSCNILVGTQMIAKGHDLPEVTLAAVVDCDVGLHMPDFRAGERVFQLLSQLAGRSGRGDKAGTVVLQTRVPKHPSIFFTQRDDFAGFAKRELENRRQLSYPPFGKLLRIIISSNQEALVPTIAKKIQRTIELFIESMKEDLIVLGPVPCSIEKIRGDYRWHLLIKAPKSTTLIKLMTAIKQHTKRDKHTKIIYDLDPQDML
jgi:primosomal protein N' (replication factor Y)